MSSVRWRTLGSRELRSWNEWAPESCSHPGTAISPDGRPIGKGINEIDDNQAQEYRCFVWSQKVHRVTLRVRLIPEILLHRYCCAEVKYGDDAGNTHRVRTRDFKGPTSDRSGASDFPHNMVRLDKSET